MAPDFVRKIPEGDNRERAVCARCSFIAYENPKLVAGVVAQSPDGRILMCKRAIEPRKGYWTLPAGFMEQHESVEAGAAREADEEARAELDMGALLGIYSIPRISQVQMFFRATLLNTPSAGPESEVVALYQWHTIPWDALAFPSVRWALEDFQAGCGLNGKAPAQRTAPVDGPAPY